MDVTVGDARFDRYYRKTRLGLRLMSHGTRAQTASDWSGLTLDQLATLRKRWMPGTEDGFRGPAPTSFKPFFGSALKASHAAIFAGIFEFPVIEITFELSRSNVENPLTGFLSGALGATLIRRLNDLGDLPRDCRTHLQLADGSGGAWRG